MEYEDIWVFQTAVRCGSLSAAAKELYTTQPSISRRISSLERELGIRILERKPGQRGLLLTPEGKKLYEIAGWITDLRNEAYEIKNCHTRRDLSVAAADLINNYLFMPFYGSFIENHPYICLIISSNYSDEIIRKLRSGEIELGYSFTPVADPFIDSSPLFEQKTVLVTSVKGNYHDGMRAEELDPEKEIFIRWAGNYEQWHDSLWPGRRYRTRIATPGMFVPMMKGKDRWAIMHESVYLALKDEIPLWTWSMETDPPSRTCYELRLKVKNKDQKETRIFREELRTYLQSVSDNEVPESLR